MSHETVGTVVLAIYIIDVIIAIVAGVILLLRTVRSSKKKVKIHFEVDPAAAEKAQKKIADLTSAFGTLTRHRAKLVEFVERGLHLARWLQDDRDAAEAKVEQLLAEVGQLQVQLAGCDVAALGATSPGQVAVKGQYGWSRSYQTVLDLRMRYDELRRRYDALTAVDDSEPTNPGR